MDRTIDHTVGNLVEISSWLDSIDNRVESLEDIVTDMHEKSKDTNYCLKRIEDILTDILIAVRS